MSNWSDLCCFHRNSILSVWWEVSKVAWWVRPLTKNSGIDQSCHQTGEFYLIATTIWVNLLPVMCSVKILVIKQAQEEGVSKSVWSGDDLLCVCSLCQLTVKRQCAAEWQAQVHRSLRDKQTIGWWPSSSWSVCVRQRLTSSCWPGAASGDHLWVHMLSQHSRTLQLRFSWNSWDCQHR